MLFSKEDFKINDVNDFLEFLPVFVFIGLIAPLVIAAYTLGFIMDQTGWLDTSS
jgi:hypothetical protein